MKTRFLEKAETAINSNIKSRFSIMGFSTNDSICGFLFYSFKITVSSNRIVKNDINKEVRTNNHFVNINWKKSMGKEGNRKPTKFENRIIITLQLKYECLYRMCVLI